MQSTPIRVWHSHHPCSWGNVEVGHAGSCVHKVAITSSAGASVLIEEGQGTHRPHTASDMLNSSASVVILDIT